MADRTANDVRYKSFVYIAAQSDSAG